MRNSLQVDSFELQQHHDELSPGSVFYGLLDESIQNNLRIAHYEQTADYCKQRLRAKGLLSESRLSSTTLVTDLLSWLHEEFSTADDAKADDPGKFSFNLNYRATDCSVECISYPTHQGQSLVFHISHWKNIPQTLEQTNLSAELASQLRAICHGTEPGITLITSRSQEVLCDIYYALLSESSSPDTKVLSVEALPRILVPGICQVTASANQLSGVADNTDSDHIFVDWQQACAPELFNKLLQQYRNTTIFVRSKDAATAIRQLTDMAISERQLATNLTSLIEVDHAYLICEHCADANQPNNSEIETMLKHEMSADSTLNYAPGCLRCEQSGRGETTMLMATYMVNNQLQSAIEKRQLKMINKTLKTLNPRSVQEQRKSLVSTGRMEIKDI